MSSQVLPPAVKGISLSTLNDRKSQSLLKALQHNKRDAEGRGWKHKSNPLRLGLNQCLAGPSTTAGVLELHTEMMDGAGYTVKRKDYLQAFEFMFTTPQEFSVPHSKYFDWCLSWLIDNVGDGITLTADTHYDEGAPHLHVLMAPIAGGRWVGGSLVTTKTWPKAQEKFGRDVGARFGLTLVPQLKGAKLAAAAREVRERLTELLAPHIDGNILDEILKLARRKPGGLMGPLGIGAASGAQAGDGGAAFKRIALSTGKGGKHERYPNPYGIEKRVQLDKQPNPYGIETDAQLGHGNPINYLCSGIESAAPQNQGLPDPTATPSTDAPSIQQSTSKGRELAPTTTPVRPLSDIPNADGEIAAPTVAKGRTSNVTLSRGSPNPQRHHHAKDLPSGQHLADGQSGADLEELADQEQDVTTRERDRDQDADAWCEQTGEFIRTTPAPTRAARTSLEALVSNGVLTRGRLPGQITMQGRA